MAGDPFASPFKAYPAQPGFKASGTSRDAAKAVASTATILRAQVLECIRQSPDGLTADEIAEKLKRSILSVRPRVSELNNAGEIEKTNQRRRNESGLSATVWRYSPRLGFEKRA